MKYIICTRRVIICLLFASVYLGIFSFGRKVKHFLRLCSLLLFLACILDFCLFVFCLLALGDGLFGFCLVRGGGVQRVAWPLAVLVFICFYLL